MGTELQTSSPHFLRVASVAPFFALCVGVLYLWGYWSTFNVNILEYLSVTDIVKTVAYPVASAFIFFAVGAVFQVAISAISDLRTQRNLGAPSGEKEATADKKRRRLSLFAEFGALLGLSTWLIAEQHSVRWVVYAVAVAIPLAVTARHFNLFGDIIRNDRLRSLAIYVIVSLGPFAFAIGKVNAEEVKNGIKYQYAMGNQLGDPISAEPNAAARQYRFLGHTSNVMFFLSVEENAVIVTSLDKLGALKLFHASSTQKKVP